MKIPLLRATGLLLVLLGVGAVSYLTINQWADRRAAEQAQDRLSAEFEQSLAAAGPTSTLVEDPTIGSTSSPISITVTTAAGEDVTGPEIHPTTPVIITETPPEPGRALGRIVIPAAGVDWLLVEGVTQADLAQGPGHMPGTALPGQPGNAVISGHRTTHGAPFGDLELLKPGDPITIETLIGTHIYEVVEVIVVAPDDVWVTNQVAGAWLTLTTCNPEGSSRERLIVFARLVAGPNAAAIPGGDGPPRSG